MTDLPTADAEPSSELFKRPRQLALDEIFQAPGHSLTIGHVWDPNAWAELTIALKSTGFRLMNAYVVYSEHPISVHIRNLHAIQHDSILVFALESQRPSVPWMPIETIDTDDSETFCRQCSMTLGWLLEREFSPAEIHTIWQELIQGKG